MELIEEERLAPSTIGDPLASSEQIIASRNLLTKALSAPTKLIDFELPAKESTNCCRICLDNTGFNDLFSHFEGERLADSLTNCTSLKVSNVYFCY